MVEGPRQQSGSLKVKRAVAGVRCKSYRFFCGRGQPVPPKEGMTPDLPRPPVAATGEGMTAYLPRDRQKTFPGLFQKNPIAAKIPLDRKRIPLYVFLPNADCDGKVL